MGRLALFPLLILLSCCNTPGLRHLGVAPTRVTEGGMTFDVRLREGYAEAIRTNVMWGVKMRDVANNGGRAIIRASGCRIAWLQGDPSVLLAGLKCGDGRKPPRKPRGKTLCTGQVSEPNSSGVSDMVFTCD